jgi:hypothetical protein
MRKGDLVRLDPNDPEIAGILDWSYGDKNYIGSRPTTPEERIAWREAKHAAIKEAAEKGEDTFSIAFDDGGESRLPPRSVSVPLPINGIYVVERARCRVSLGWGNPESGMVKILNTSNGEHAYVKRNMLKVVKDESV